MYFVYEMIDFVVHIKFENFKFLLSVMIISIQKFLYNLIIKLVVRR